MKKKAREYELENLVKMKETKSESKMRELKYEKLQAQEYLSSFDVKKAQTIFRFRVRMERFSGNYKGGGPPELCPLCNQHSDIQELCIECPVVISKIGVTENYSNIFKNNISGDLVGKLQQIMKLRKKD